MHTEKKQDQKQVITLWAFAAVALNILVTKVAMLIRPSLRFPADASMINKFFFAFLGVGVVFLLWKTPVFLNKACVMITDRKAFGKQMKFSSLISTLLVVVMIVMRLILNQMNPEVAARPFFGLYLNIHGRWFYPISSVIQEIFIKGLVQENFRCFDTNGKKYSILINAVFFSILHMNYALYYMVGAFLLCFVTGFMYEKHRNIWGSALIHFVIGFMPRALGLKV